MEIKSIKDFEKIIEGKDFNGAVILCGEEKNFVDQSIELVYKKIIDFPELNILRLDGDSTTIDEIINACETLPFMGRKKLVHINRSSFLGKENSMGADFVKRFAEYLKNIPENIILLLSIDSQPEQNNAIVKTIKAIGLFAEYKKIRGDELLNWVQREFEKNSKSINRVEANYLIAEVGNSMELLEREIEKICSYAIEEELVIRPHIDAVIHKSMESNIFKMVDSISRKDANSAIGILNILLFQKEEPLKILGMIIRQIRLLFIIKAGLNNKRTTIDINRELRLNNYVFDNLVKQSRNYSEERLRKLLSACLETDFNLKNGGFSHDFYGLALEILIVELCK